LIGKSASAEDRISGLFAAQCSDATIHWTEFSMLRSVVTFAAMALVAAMIVPHLAAQMNERPAPRIVAARPQAPTEPVASSVDSVEVPRDAFGRFRVEGRIDGRSLEFTVDTGASIVALTADDAAQLGIRPMQSEYRVLLKTANGMVRAASTTLDTLEIGDIMVHDVAAVVMPDGALSDNLLGMSFLSRLHHFDYSEGKMVLER
jgi:aspartyl protease family protein